MKESKAKKCQKKKKECLKLDGEEAKESKIPREKKKVAKNSCGFI